MVIFSYMGLEKLYHRLNLVTIISLSYNIGKKVKKLSH